MDSHHRSPGYEPGEFLLLYRATFVFQNIVQLIYKPVNIFQNFFLNTTFSAASKRMFDLKNG
jgi:hypothetical protein